MKVHYVKKDGTVMTVEGKVGDNAMYLAQQMEVEIEGACEASLACCTCHVYVDQGYLSRLKEPDEK